MCKRPQLCATQEQGPLKVRLLVQKDRNKPSWLTELPPKTNPKPRLSPSFGFVCKHFKTATLTFLGNGKKRGAFGVQLLPSPTSAKPENHNCFWKPLLKITGSFLVPHHSQLVELKGKIHQKTKWNQKPLRNKRKPKTLQFLSLPTPLSLPHSPNPYRKLLSYTSKKWFTPDKWTLNDFKYLASYVPLNRITLDGE